MERKKKLTANEYIKMAEQCEDYQEYATALKYYETAYEMDSKLKVAMIGIDRMKSEIAKQVFYKTEASCKLIHGRLELRNGLLVFVGMNGMDLSYQIDDIQNLRVALGRLTFDYPGESAPVGFNCKAPKDWIGIISDAKGGKYPQLEERGFNTLEKFIADHFTKDTMEDAMEYCMQMSGMGPADAKIIVGRIFGVE